MSLIVWWGTRVECTAALARSERDGRIKPGGARTAFAGLDRLRDQWTEIDPNETLRRVTERLLRTHLLRTADALQLAAAMRPVRGGTTA
ncbi:hypothetical protein BH20CHL7_BH20CHL7_18820 [soil metagenome]